MNIGAMDRRIVLQSQSLTANDYGEQAVTWFNYATVWAAIERKPHITESESGRQITSFQKVVFTIRNSSQVSSLEASHRIQYNSKFYNVIGVQEIGRDEKLRIVAEIADAS